MPSRIAPCRLTVLLLILAALPAAGQDRDAFMRCAGIAGDAERLSCYDRLARDLIELGSAGGASAAVAASAGPATGTAASTGAPSSPPPQAAPATADTPKETADPASAAPDEESSFGIEQTREAKFETVESIRTRIAGEFEGWEGKGTRFELENGQVWEQIDTSRWRHQETSPEVVIERGMFGSYQLSLEGSNRSVRVRRIK